MHELHERAAQQIINFLLKQKMIQALNEAQTEFVKESIIDIIEDSLESN